MQNIENLLLGNLNNLNFLTKISYKALKKGVCKINLSFV